MTANQIRLASLAGRSCPVCAALEPLRRPDRLVFDGCRLRCERGHTYSNADAAEAETDAVGYGEETN